MKKEYKILAALLALFLALFLNNLRNAKIKRVDKLTYKTAQRQPTVPTAGLGLPGIETELLTPERGPFRMGKKNIFEPLSFVKKSPPRKAAPPKAVVKEAPLPLPEVVPKAIANYTFLGFMEKGNIKTIFLMKDDETFIVKKGDTLSDDYVVQNITDEYIEISSVEGTDTMKINLVENAPLTGKQ